MIVKLKLCTFSLEFHLGQFVWSCYKLLANDNMNGIERNFERFTFYTGLVTSRFAHHDTINKLRNSDCKRNLSPMILKGNQMVYS